MCGCTYGGSERQSKVPAKLNDFLPNEVLTKGRLSWDVEDELIVMGRRRGKKLRKIRGGLQRQALEHALSQVLEDWDFSTILPSM